MQYPKDEQQKIMYKAWCEMRGRCLNKNNPYYYRYGERGIKVCERWNKWINFEEDMKDSWVKGKSLNRIDNDKDYCPENCNWATPKEQANNRSTNKLIHYNGQTKTLAYWIEELGLKSSNVRTQFYTMKWPIEKCFAHPYNKITAGYRKVKSVKNIGRTQGTSL